jgi:AcrR family transcriptional regulator
MTAISAYSGPSRSDPVVSERRVRSEQRREMLLDAADTVIRRIGSRVSATLIAQEAGVTKPIIYRHFDDIQDLYRALAARHNERLHQWLLASRERNSDLNRRQRFRGVRGDCRSPRRHHRAASGFLAVAGDGVRHGRRASHHG